jgi:hypothetical protein
MLVAVLIVAVLVAADVAEARVLTGIRAQRAVAHAEAYWQARPMCERIELRTYEEDDGHAARAPLGGCWIEIREGWLRTRPWRADFCGVVVHEFGHLLGLGHGPGLDRRGVMDPMFGLQVPPRCWWPRWRYRAVS